ncbi:MAG: hypothetical protein ABEJ78_12095 [Haloferacaceae archaeon]
MTGYRGILGAFPYAFRASGSLLFRSYVVLSAVVAALVTVLFGLALVVLVGQSAGAVGGTLTLSRAFYVLVALFVVAPVVAPTLFVARRHRRGEAGDDAYDVGLALAGYLFLASLYVGLVATVPEAQQTTPTGALAPVARTLYALPPVAGVVPPLACALVIYLVHRTLR